MSKRRVTPKGRRAAPSLIDSTRSEAKADGQWWVRPLTGAASTKDYRCPGCQHLIRPATPHLVAWPAQKALLSEAAIDERRHWHTMCWRRKH